MFTYAHRGATLYLPARRVSYRIPEPVDLLIALQTRLWETVPTYDDTRRHPSGFTPHLSVGQVRDAAEARALIDTLADTWQDLSCTVAAVQLIWR